MLYHIVIVGFSAALALSLPMAVRFWQNNFFSTGLGLETKNILPIREIILTVCFILLSATLRRAGKIGNFPIWQGLPGSCLSPLPRAS